MATKFKIGDRVIDGVGNIGIIVRKPNGVSRVEPYTVYAEIEQSVWEFTQEGQFSEDPSDYDIRHLTPLEKLI